MPGRHFRAAVRVLRVSLFTLVFTAVAGRTTAAEPSAEPATQTPWITAPALPTAPTPRPGPSAEQPSQAAQPERTEPARTEPERTEPVRAEPVRTESEVQAAPSPTPAAPTPTPAAPAPTPEPFATPVAPVSEPGTRPTWRQRNSRKNVASASATPAVQPPPKVPRVDPRNRRLSLVGNIVSGLGVVSFMGSVASLVIARDAGAKLDYPRVEKDDEVYQARRDQLKRRQRAANISAATTAGLSVALVAGGITMISVARRREASRRDRLGITALAPALAPGFVGVQWVGRW